MRAAVDMQSDEAFALDLHPANRQLVDYWRSKSRGGAVPFKSAIDPSEIPRLLPDLLVYERIAPDHVRVRVVGTRVTARLGVDPTGGNIFELFADRYKSGVMDAMNRVLDEPCVQVATVRDRYPSGRQLLVEVVRLPLADEAGNPRYILSSTAELRRPGPTEAGEAPDLIAEPVVNAFVPLDSVLQATPERG